MAFCAKCGNQMVDGAKFCPSCGASAAGKSKAPVITRAQTGELKADPDDAERNKGMAINNKNGISAGNYFRRGIGPDVPEAYRAGA